MTSWPGTALAGIVIVPATRSAGGMSETLVGWVAAATSLAYRPFSKLVTAVIEPP